MTREQAMEYFRYGDSLNYKQLVANIIVAATALRWDETRGVREFWYNPIKAIILRLFPEVNEAHGNAKKYKQFDAALSDLTKDGVITYNALGISDYRTMRELYEAMDKANCWGNDKEVSEDRNQPGANVGRDTGFSEVPREDDPQ